VNQLDELRLVVVTDNETDMLSSIDSSEQCSETDGLLEQLEPIDGQTYPSTLDHLCCASHGFSVLATGRQDDQARTILFDVGPYGDVWLANAQRLGIDLSQIETIFLSHWHWDHSGGLEVAIGAIATARRVAGFGRPVVDLHPDRPELRAVAGADGTITLLPVDPTIDMLVAAGADVVLHDTDHEIADGFFLGSGEIARLTDFETGFHGHLTQKDGTLKPDPLILDERFLAVDVVGRGVTVLSACSHAGIVNASSAAMSTTGLPLDLVLGGFHLAGKVMEKRIAETVESLVVLDPRLVAPGHCTGWRAKAALAQAFSPTARYAPSVVGTQYRLLAET
jgi:7,8-dihydropterin-6-yl-methyl-4-(beta-D-ribofuranosyl)aminobenzene 5'-phosphate synthase